MSAAAEPSAPAAPQELRTRLQAYSRYVALVAEQLEALERGEAGRVRELEDERAGLEEELGAEGVQALLDEGLVAVEQRLADDLLLRARWASLRDGAVRATRALHRGRPGRGRYLDADALATRLDVRF